MDFLTGKPLSDTIYDTLFKAEKELIIISPYIQLDDYLKDNIFKQHLNRGNAALRECLRGHPIPGNLSAKSSPIELELSLSYLPSRLLIE